MVAEVCRLASAPWDRLATDNLSVDESLTLTQHIEHCPYCRSHFEEVCASRDLWDDSAVALKQIPTDIPGVSTHGHSLASHSRNPNGTRIILSGLAPGLDDESLGELDEFSIREVLGFGGMGTVFKAWDRKLCRIVAIKLLHPHLAANGAARTRFAREAQSAAGIAHPNVVPIHNVASERELPYIVMAYVPGGSLQDKIDRDGPLSLLESLRIAAQIAEGLSAAHQQTLVHRDIKPANILLESSYQRAFITDFGLARALDDVSLTASGMLAGTPQYMSPEQSRGDTIDARSDLFSLGSVLYTMLTGRAPFRGDNAVSVLRSVYEASPQPITQVDEQLPAWVQGLMERFLTRHPQDRIATAHEAAKLLQDCLHHVQKPTQNPLPNNLIPAPSISMMRWVCYSIVASLSVALLTLGITWLRPLDSKPASSITPPAAISSSVATLPNEPPPSAREPEPNPELASVLDLLPSELSRDSIDDRLQSLEMDLLNLILELNENKEGRKP